MYKYTAMMVSAMAALFAAIYFGHGIYVEAENISNLELVSGANPGYGHLVGQMIGFGASCMFAFAMIGLLRDLQSEQ